jgi:hypothetical protein
MQDINSESNARVSLQLKSGFVEKNEGSWNGSRGHQKIVMCFRRGKIELVEENIITWDQ